MNVQYARWDFLARPRLFSIRTGGADAAVVMGGATVNHRTKVPDAPNNLKLTPSVPRLMAIFKRAQPVLVLHLQESLTISRNMNDVKDKLKTVLEPIELPGDDPRSQIVEMILGLPLFQNLEMREADLLARFIKPCRVREDAVIFQEGEEGSFMGLVVEGLAEVSKENSGHEAVKVAAEGTGRVLGEMALVDGEPRSATARFVKSGTILLLTKESFDRILSQHPQLGNSILLRICRMLSQRLRRTTGILSDFLQP